ncbi:alpha/beta hydrolase [Nocardioides ferulae]|uniref:alpha/beta hydrolase n=1 Tax=Nocardioides ferulae TaxID=2340821 RepID=UPI000EB37686|nr:alpha/beta hydrolase [Nocardioides ferulae]
MSAATSPPAHEPGVLDALALLGHATEELLVGGIRDTHHAWADRVHGVVREATGGASAVPELAHRAISSAVFAGVGAGLRTASHGLDRLGRRGHGPRLEATPRGRFVSSAVNGLIGDRLVRERPHLAFPMAVRSEGRDVPLEPAALARAFPEAAQRIVVFVHGLCENESYWRHRRAERGPTYAEALGAEGWTPVMLRANTGLGVRENGVALSSLMQRLVEHWPTEVARIAMIGHSMGGLVIRAAGAVVDAEPGERRGPAGATDWTRLVSDVVTLGTPHLGAPIARGIGHGSRALSRLPETAAIGRFLDWRSAGVHDLVAGLAADVPPMPRARYRLVAATVTGSPRHPVGHVVGDLLVRVPSACGHDRHGVELFPGAEVLHVGRADHFDLLNHAHVHRALRSWLG